MLVLRSFIDDSYYAVALLHCGVSLLEPLGSSFGGFKSLLIFLIMSFSSTFEIVGSKLISDKSKKTIREMNQGNSLASLKNSNSRTQASHICVKMTITLSSLK